MSRRSASVAVARRRARFSAVLAVGFVLGIGAAPAWGWWDAHTSTVGVTITTGDFEAPQQAVDQESLEGSEQGDGQ